MPINHRGRRLILAIATLPLLLILPGCTGVELPGASVGPRSEVLERAQRVLYVAAGAQHGDGSRSRPFGSVQSAIDAARSGDAVLVLPGRYVGNVRLRSHVSLVGSGAQVTTLTADAGIILTADQAFDVVVEGVTVDGENAAEHGLRFDWQRIGRPGNADPIVFRGNVVKNTLGHAVCGQYAVVLVEKNEIHHCRGDGVNLFRVQCKIVGNTITDVGTGVYVQDDRAEVARNTIRRVRRDGVLFHNVTWGVLERNDIHDAGGDGIVCEEGTAPGLRGNRIVNAHRAGVAVRYGAAPVLRGNRISASGEFGVYCDGSAGAIRPDLGRKDDWGYNAISGSATYDVSNTTLREIPAVGNWWGTPKPSSDRFLGLVDFTEPLPEAPTDQAA